MVALRLLLILVLVSAFWKLAVVMFSIPSYILPAPESVIFTLTRNANYYASHAAMTFSVAVISLLLAATAALVIGVGVHLSARFGDSLYPALIGLQAVPMIAMAPIVTMWFGVGFGSRVLMAALVTFPAILVGVVVGLKRQHESDIIFSKLLTNSKWQILWRLELPRSVPSIIAAIKVGSTLSIIGAIVAEYTGSSAGIGYAVMQATYRTDASALMAAVLLAMAMGLGMYALVDAGAKKAVRRFL